jgi:hypothetical protein
MQIIYKQHENGYQCLFDTRSNQFFSNGGNRISFLTEPLLELANSIVNKSDKQILEIAQSYSDDGDTEKMIAAKYLEMNPDIKQRVFEKLSAPKVNKKRTYTGKKRGRKAKIEAGEAKPKVVNLDENGQPRKRGRPKKSV